MSETKNRVARNSSAVKLSKSRFVHMEPFLPCIKKCPLLCINNNTFLLEIQEDYCGYNPPPPVFYQTPPPVICRIWAPASVIVSSLRVWHQIYLFNATFSDSICLQSFLVKEKACMCLEDNLEMLAVNPNTEPESHWIQNWQELEVEHPKCRKLGLKAEILPLIYKHLTQEI